MQKLQGLFIRPQNRTQQIHQLVMRTNLIELLSISVWLEQNKSQNAYGMEFADLLLHSASWYKNER